MNELLKDIKKQFKIVDTIEFAGQTTVCVSAQDAHGLIAHLKDTYDFNYLVDLTVIDNLRHPEDRPERFAAVYHVGNMLDGRRLRIRAYISEESASIATISDLYANGGWLEREAFDLFGIDFVGHPDLRRILMPDHFDGHPLRKDFPLKGRGFRDNFPKYQDIPEE